MTPDISRIDTDVPEISQIGIVVEDLDDGMERYGAILGLTEWEVYRFEPPTLTKTTLRGEEHDYSMKLALGFIGEMMMELIEPMEGESLYTEHLEEQGEGLHHIACFAFEDPHGVVEEFEDAGMPVVQSGNFGGTRYWYFDTTDVLNGVIFETGANVDSMPEPDRTVEL
ncbi:MAG: methylmalonyl-CoA/ethylmalonyl-CoA epimerase [Natrialbaceae archaeon]|jgi:methylmalonyl-CoA/ethylmalonyl-CoA epimerase